MDRWSHMWLDSKMCHQDSPSKKDFSNCKQCGLQTASSSQLLRSQKLPLWRPLYPKTEQWGDTKTLFHPDANHSDATFHCRALYWISHHFVRLVAVRLCPALLISLSLHRCLSPNKKRVSQIQFQHLLPEKQMTEHIVRRSMNLENRAEGLVHREANMRVKKCCR